MPYWFDGNNLIGQSAAAARADRRTRAAFLSTLSDRRSAGGGRFLVWFDGDDPADMRPPPGVAVRYSAPESTDAAICRRLREIERPGEVIVVTNDRELSSRCRDAGASVWDWIRFTSKMQARSAASTYTARQIPGNSRRRPGKPLKPLRTAGEDIDAVDVDDWISYFGMDSAGPDTEDKSI